MMMMKLTKRVFLTAMGSLLGTNSGVQALPFAPDFSNRLVIGHVHITRYIGSPYGVRYWRDVIYDPCYDFEIEDWSYLKKGMSLEERVEALNFHYCKTSYPKYLLTRLDEYKNGSIIATTDSYNEALRFLNKKFGLQNNDFISEEGDKSYWEKDV